MHLGNEGISPVTPQSLKREPSLWPPPRNHQFKSPPVQPQTSRGCGRLAKDTLTRLWSQERRPPAALRRRVRPGPCPQEPGRQLRGHCPEGGGSSQGWDDETRRGQDPSQAGSRWRDTEVSPFCCRGAGWVSSLLIPGEVYRLLFALLISSDFRHAKPLAGVVIFTCPPTQHLGNTFGVRVRRFPRILFPPGAGYWARPGLSGSGGWGCNSVCGSCGTLRLLPGAEPLPGCARVPLVSEELCSWSSLGRV